MHNYFNNKINFISLNLHAAAAPPIVIAAAPIVIVAAPIVIAAAVVGSGAIFN